MRNDIGILLCARVIIREYNRNKLLKRLLLAAGGTIKMNVRAEPPAGSAADYAAYLYSL